MADYQQARPGVAGQSRSTLATMTNLLGAAVSLGLLIGVGVWGYKLLMRDVSGVPVVRAAEGPMRVQPDNPGGAQAQHQGLSVNGVAAEGTAAAPADRLVLAPQPLDVTEEDVVATAAQPATRAEPVIAPELAAMLAREPVSEEEETLQLAAVEELASRLADGVAPLAEADELEAEVEETAAAPEIEGGLKRSLRPRLRPVKASQTGRTATATATAAVASGNDTAEAIAAAVASAAPSALDVDPEAIPVGTRLAQLGAYDSPEVARSEWDRLNARFGEYLEGKNRVVQKAKSGGRTFYRLRAMGFADLSDARRFCSALVAEKAECIPVVTR